MFNRKYIIRNLLLPVISLLGIITGFGSCSDNKVLDETLDSSVGEITLTINTGKIASTRTLTYGEDDGTDIENYIDLDSLEVWLCDYSGNGSNIEEFVPYSKQRTGNNTYELKAEMTDDLRTRLQSGFRIFVIANCGHSYFNKYSTYDNLQQRSTTTVFVCSSYYDNVNKTSFTPSDSLPIPMFGVRSFQNGVELKTDWSVDLGTIDLIRDMAKVVVRCDSTATISNVKMVKLNDRLTIMPYQMFYNTAQPVDANLLIPREHDGSISSPTVYENIPFNKVDDRTYEIYVPEYRNVSSSNPAWVSLDYNGANYKLEFKDYTDNSAFNLIRNTIYIYDVVRSDFTYSVEPWAEYTSGDITFN